MRLIVSGILTDYLGRVLLQQSGPRTLVPIQRPLEPGTLPPDTLARAFREATALFVMPVRLTGLYFDNHDGDATLTFSLRCIMRGGDLDPGRQPPAGFFDLPLPGALAPRFRSQVDQALHHAGGPPLMARVETGRSAILGRLLGSKSPAPESVAWEVAICLAIHAGDGSIIRTRSDTASEWRLPTAAILGGEAPWQTTGSLLRSLCPDTATSLLRVAVIEVAADRPALTLIFAADAPGIKPPTTETLSLGSRDELDQFAPADIARLDRIDWTPPGGCQWVLLDEREANQA